MLLLFSILVFVVGKVSLDLVVGNVFKACVLQLRLVSERVAAALVVCIHAGEVEGVERVLVLLELDLVAVATTTPLSARTLRVSPLRVTFTPTTMRLSGS